MELDPSSMEVLEVYRWMVGLVTPRPIAWVTTISSSGVVNLAPFSFFNAFGANPPVVVFSPALRMNGTKKDTLKNIEATGEFVVNAATERHTQLVNLSSSELPYDESELTLVELETSPSRKVKPPRLAEAPFAMECKVMQILPLGNGSISGNLVIGEVVQFHVSESILAEDGKPDPHLLKAIARLGGEYWCRSTDLFQLPRPSSPK